MPALFPEAELRVKHLMKCRNLIKKPWAFIGVAYMNPTILGVIGPGFLNQVPTSRGQ